MHYKQEIKNEKNRHIWTKSTKRYLKEHKNSGFSIGDTVRVTQKATDLQSGWQGLWSNIFMTPFIGNDKEYTIVEDGGTSGFGLSDGERTYFFPYFCLERVNREEEGEDEDEEEEQPCT